MCDEKYAPIIVFAFNRLNSLKKTISSLLDNEEAKDSDLFVFVDGPRKSKIEEKKQVVAVQDYIKTISGFKSLTFYFSEENKGLGPSIIAGVSKIINQYNRAIILEDDLVLSKNFLAFINEGLQKYEVNNKVFSICGYSNRVTKPSDYEADSYFCTRSSSWGWATWADRWNSVDWELNDWENYTKYKNDFNKWGGSDCFKMLNDWKIGKNKSWAIRFCFSQFLQNKVSLFPIISKVANNGFDGNGTNCKKYSRFKFDYDNTEKKNFKYPSNTNINKKIYKSVMIYNSILIRLWSRIRYLIG
jgi:GR25 family glycosyltransferase involved in LPS biosynthesis